MAELDEIEIRLRKAEAGAAEAETARLREILDEVVETLRGAGTAEEKVAWLIDRLHA